MARLATREVFPIVCMMDDQILLDTGCVFTWFDIRDVEAISVL